MFYISVCMKVFLRFCLQNAARIVRALFEIALRKRWPAMTYRLLNLCKVIDKRLWGWAHPLRQFSILSPSVLTKLEDKNLTIDKLRDMGKDEIGQCAFVLYNIHLSMGVHGFRKLGLRYTAIYRLCMCVCAQVTCYTT